MSAQIIDGKEVARQRLSMLADRVAERKNKGLHTPCLAVILVGDDPASAVYVRNKKSPAKKRDSNRALMRCRLKPRRTSCWHWWTN